MKEFKEIIWKENEYDYPAAYGFTPNIHAYLHEDDAERDCLIVVPGGAYCMCVPPEASLPAIEFYKRGMNVFVLTYTTDITCTFLLKKQPMNDLARAVRFVRKREDDYKIRGKKLLVCGFSAGAHVCGSLAVHYKEIEDINLEYKDISCKPDGAILSYPVITAGEHSHEFSIWQLVGRDASEEEKNYFSLEKQVTKDTVPCFIWQTADDNLVPVENSYLMAEALKKNGVYFAHFVFPEGFHGLSVPNKDFFAGNFGEEYTMEQVFNAVKAVKEGKGVNVSEQREKELKEQFADKKEENGGNENPFLKEGVNPVEQFSDVGKWPDLCMKWMERIDFAK